MSSEYFFFVAEASAISRAPKTMSRGTFFSRASTSTSITSSRLPAARFAATSLSSQFRYQPRPLDIVERQRDLLSLRSPIQLHVHVACLGAAQHADELAAPACVRGAHPQLGLLAGEARESARLAQRPVQTRRGHLQPLE